MVFVTVWCCWYCYCKYWCLLLLPPYIYSVPFRLILISIAQFMNECVQISNMLIRVRIRYGTGFIKLIHQFFVGLFIFFLCSFFLENTLSYFCFYVGELISKIALIVFVFNVTNGVNIHIHNTVNCKVYLWQRTCHQIHEN